MSELELQLANYRLTTAHILYHMPDHPKLLQEFIWQELDLAPKYPILTKFLAFWQAQIDGRLHSVRIAQSRLIKPAEFRAVGGLLYMH
jgi:uncharacterized protein Usg